MNQPNLNRIDELFADTALIERTLQQAVREALLLHRQRGFPIAEWRNGQVVWVSPNEITLPPENVVPDAQRSG